VNSIQDYYYSQAQTLSNAHFPSMDKSNPENHIKDVVFNAFLNP